MSGESGSTEGAASASLDVRVALRGAFALDAAFVAPPGFTVVSGPSGAGKSTLLAAIAGFVRPDEGRVALGPEPWFDRDRRVDLAPERRHVAMVFQSLALFPHLTAAENVAYGAPRALDRRARAELAAGLLDRLRVAHVARRRPSTFSGGEAQRVALARALAMKPRAVLLDEPFSALDVALRRELVADVRGLLRELAVPVLLVTHAADEGAPGDRYIALAGGRIVRSGVV
jgi:molybdate transport system ATP-binding protein